MARQKSRILNFAGKQDLTYRWHTLKSGTNVHVFKNFDVKIVSQQQQQRS